MQDTDIKKEGFEATAKPEPIDPYEWLKEVEELLAIEIFTIRHHFRIIFRD